VNSSGTTQASYRYDPYGNLLSSSGSLAAANTYRFSSKEWMGTPGLYYYGYRFYSPTWQRWLNRDPIQEQGGLNLFGFIANNPLGFIDPLGLENNNAPPPCAPYPECMRGPEPPATTFGEFCKDSSGYMECYVRCMLGLPTAADVAAHLGGAKKAVGTYYHFTDGRFTAWGRCSKVMVPRAVARINLVGAVVGLCDAAHCMDRCLKETSEADPDPPRGSYYPPEFPLYPPSWPGNGRNAPPNL
jgi:RHS repeat-associated protein